MQRLARMKKEVKMLTESPAHGISCWANDNDLNSLEAQIIGGEGTPYSGGIFKLEIQIPDRYPFEPPKVRFLTPIYHPNIDTGGRICLDTLKMPPKGAWKPVLNISTVLTSIQLLMAEPNPDDPLMTDISNEFRHNNAQFVANAKAWTDKHAKQSNDLPGPCSTSTQEHKVQENMESQTSTQKSDGKKRSLPMDDMTNKHLKHHDNWPS